MNGQRISVAERMTVGKLVAKRSGLIEKERGNWKDRRLNDSILANIVTYEVLKVILPYKP